MMLACQQNVQGNSGIIIGASIWFATAANQLSITFERILLLGKLFFTGVASVTLNFHPQGLMRKKLKSQRPGGHCDLIRWYQALAALTPEQPGPTATNSHNSPHTVYPFPLEDYWPSLTGVDPGFGIGECTKCACKCVKIIFSATLTLKSTTRFGHLGIVTLSSQLASTSMRCG